MKEVKEEYLEVIGAGWGRTGTMSLKEALEILGYPCYHMIEVIQRNHVAFWINLSDQKTEDFNQVFQLKEKPSAVFWEKQRQVFPHAKVILTVRDPVINGTNQHPIRSLRWQLATQIRLG